MQLFALSSKSVYHNTAFKLRAMFETVDRTIGIEKKSKDNAGLIELNTCES